MADTVRHPGWQFQDLTWPGIFRRSAPDHQTSLQRPDARALGSGTRPGLMSSGRFDGQAERVGRVAQSLVVTDERGELGAQVVGGGQVNSVQATERSVTDDLVKHPG